MYKSNILFLYLWNRNAEFLSIFFMTYVDVCALQKIYTAKLFPYFPMQLHYIILYVVITKQHI